MKLIKYVSMLGLAAASPLAFSLQVDQSQYVSNASISVNSFAPVGQSFSPAHNLLSQVSLELLDVSTATNGSNAHVVLRESDISGPIIATSETVYLEDCFNFEQGPGCGTAGGYGKAIPFQFAQGIELTPGSQYVIEIIVSGDSVGVNYAYNDEYANGGMYKEGDIQSNDLWFATASQQESNENILVSNGDQLSIYDSDGTLLSSVTIPKNTTNESSRDLFQLGDGKIAVFNGTFQPVLSVLEGESWNHYSFSGWSTANNISYGGITAYQNYVYVTDGSTSGASEKGIVRFDVDNAFAASRFFTSNEYIDVTLGLNNKLYALRNTYGDLDVIDPESMTILQSLDLGHTSSSRAVIADAEGNIYMASWSGNVTHFSSDGTSINSVSIGGSLYDIDINYQGELLVSDRNGTVTRIESNLNVIGTFSADDSGVFVAYGNQSPTDPEPKPDYCEAKGNNTYYEWIEAVSVNGLSVQSGNNQGYFLDENTLWELSASQVNSLQLIPGFGSSSYTEKWNVWVDVNDDHIFEESEKVYSASSRSTLNTNISLAGATPGKVRMRISMQYGSYPQACGSFTYGEVEDFVVNITE
ncbi:GEVED domain-containing protein [Aliikangiella sp. G2MR2-5]|uniref:GEVED domain-containing protein n=1 Tax=Aliikangiella sp. G2MR2-5 TaxID=2788943 RepID=UPI0018A9178A|nr:GEVED domain-containing protein [Aliikangiella sp. G2MR2-5]